MTNIITIPFNLILNRTFQLIDMIAIANSFELEIALRNELDNYLDKCGWSEEAFDAKLLKVIDNNWQFNLN